ncbi:hypothetical protein OS31_19000 [Dickeya oryzae]
MYQLHIANKNYSSWSLRPWILLKTLDIPFEEILTPFAPAPVQTAFKTFSPTGKVPCLVDDGITVWDSLSITEYLAEDVPAVWPQDKAARAWARSAAAEMHSGFNALRNQCSMSCGVRVELHAITPELQRDIDRLNQLWQEGIARFGGPFLAGAQFSAVDAFFRPGSLPGTNLCTAINGCCGTVRQPHAGTTGDAVMVPAGTHRNLARTRP